MSKHHDDASSSNELDVFDMMNNDQDQEIDLGESTDEDEAAYLRKEAKKAKKKAAKKERKKRFKQIEKRREKMRKARFEAMKQRKNQPKKDVGFVLVTKKNKMDDKTVDDQASDSSVSSVSSVATEDLSSSDDNRFSFGPIRFYKPKPLPPWVPATSLEEQRKRYACGSRYVTLSKIPSIDDDESFHHRHPEPLESVNHDFNKKISLYRGNITTLEIDAIVNAANSSLFGGGGIDGAIRDAAGRHIDEATRKLNGCPEGQTKMTLGYNLPAKFVLHTVGPMMEKPAALRSSYDTVLEHVATNKDIRTVGLCCVSTGIFGYPLRHATHIALTAVREWLPKHMNDVDRIIFVVFTPSEYDVYKQCIPKYFPTHDADVPVLEESKEAPRRRFFHHRFHPSSSSDSSDNEDDDLEEYRRFQRKHGYRVTVPSFQSDSSSSSPPPPPPPPPHHRHFNS